jgi:hypothetical protein
MIQLTVHTDCPKVSTRNARLPRRVLNALDDGGDDDGADPGPRVGLETGHP